MTDTTSPVGPLAGVRVVDLTDGTVGAAGRYLAELGADVILVEPPTGLPSRTAEPVHAGHGLRFATAHANKRGVVIDVTTPEGAEQLLGLTDGAQIVLESFPVGRLAELGLGADVMRSRNDALVVVSVTPFGQEGPYRDWASDDLVVTAMSSMLTRSGAPGREPLAPPGELGTETAAVSVAFVALLAHLDALRNGSGQHVDCSVFDLVVQDIDPGFGMAGTATMGRPLTELPPGRSDARMLYPILPCADGHVRMFIASPKQWRALYEWMGSPEQFSDESFAQIITRFMKWDEIRPVIEQFLADKTRSDIVAKAAELGIAISALHTAEEVLASDHVRERQSFVTVEVAPDLSGDIANGFVELDGVRAGFRHRAPSLGEHTEEVFAETTRSVGGGGDEKGSDDRRPLAGVRVLDLGVIVVGGETGRSLADQGADVIKVENKEFLDGARQADSPDKCSHAFAVGNRGKRSMGLNLRSDEGKEIFRRLVAKSDVVLTNFKPGTLEGLDLGYETLSEINPGIVLVESSALGSRGPWSKQMGYGPLVRATVGLTRLWRHPDTDDGFGDDMTVYPDHAASRVAVVAVVAALIERRSTGRGRKIELAQMETVFAQLATGFLRESLEPGTLVARGNVGEFDAPTGLYPCDGEDAYCAISVGDNDQWRRLAEVIDRTDLRDDPAFADAAGRVDHRDALDEAVSSWTRTRTPTDVQDILQGAGVPAGAAAHVKDLENNPQLIARHQLGSLQQPGYDDPIAVVAGPALFEAIPEPDYRAAPFIFTDTRAVCREVLGMESSEIDEFVDAGVLTVADGTS